MPKKREQPFQSAPWDVLRLLDERFISAIFPNIPALKALAAQEAPIAARRAFAEARGASEIDAGMRRRGLVQVLSRARSYAPFSQTRARPKLISIVPYNAPDPSFRFVGSVGLSDGEPASGIIVELAGTNIVKFTTLDFLEGQYGEREISTEELITQGPAKLIEDRKRGNLEPDITINVSAKIADDAFRVLLTDEAAMSVYSQDDIQGFMSNIPIVNMIAELQFMRTRGLAASPDTSCCCCCCCCWGSCSSCSAVSSNYLSKTYSLRTAN